MELRLVMHVLTRIEAEGRQLHILEDRVRWIDKTIAQQVGHRHLVQAPAAAHVAVDCREVRPAVVGRHGDLYPLLLRRRLALAVLHQPGQHHRQQVEPGSVVLVVQSLAVALQPGDGAGQQVVRLHREVMHLVEALPRQAAQVEAETTLARDVRQVREARGDMPAHQHLVGPGHRIDALFRRQLCVDPFAQRTVAERVGHAQRQRRRGVQALGEAAADARDRTGDGPVLVKVGGRFDLGQERAKTRPGLLGDFAAEQFVDLGVSESRTREHALERVHLQRRHHVAELEVAPEQRQFRGPDRQPQIPGQPGQHAFAPLHRGAEVTVGAHAVDDAVPAFGRDRGRQVHVREQREIRGRQWHARQQFQVAVVSASRIADQRLVAQAELLRDQGGRGDLVLLAAAEISDAMRLRPHFGRGNRERR